VISAIEGGYIRGRAERSTQPLTEAGEWLAAIASHEGMSRAAQRSKDRDS
jgi:hypothetical protein